MNGNSNSLLQEECLSLAQAAKRLPRVRGKKPPHPSTLYRWATQGRKSSSGEVVHLEMVRVGGTNCTSVAALTRFFNRLSGEKVADLPAPQPFIEKRTAMAENILRHRGLLK